MSVSKLTKQEYDVLNKIATKSKMDCWFLIKESEDGLTDYIMDLEENKEMSLTEGILTLHDGINYPGGYLDCELTDVEIDVLSSLLSKLELDGDDICESNIDTISRDVDNLLLTFFNGAICNAKDSIKNESIALVTCGVDEDNPHGHNIEVLEGFIDRINGYIKDIENKEVNNND